MSAYPGRWEEPPSGYGQRDGGRFADEAVRQSALRLDDFDKYGRGDYRSPSPLRRLNFKRQLNYVCLLSI